jgi:hypothetical protein
MSENDSMRAISGAQLGEKMVHMRFHRCMADMERGGDFLVGISTPNKGEDVSFSPGKRERFNRRLI